MHMTLDKQNICVYCGALWGYRDTIQINRGDVAMSRHTMKHSNKHGNKAFSYVLVSASAICYIQNYYILSISDSRRYYVAFGRPLQSAVKVKGKAIPVTGRGGP
jgi:hypothetical protein